jgi:hypothetical protein
VYDPPVISLDVAATATALAGLAPDPALDGVNLVPYLTGQATGAPHESLYWRWGGQCAIRQGHWKYLEGNGKRYLFDLAADIGETRNLITHEPARAAALRGQLETWSRTLDPPGLPDRSSLAEQNYFKWYLDGQRGAPAKAPPPGRPATPGTPDDGRNPVSPATLFTRRDANKDGKVTLEEFLVGRDGDKRPPLERRFKALDRDGDGIWSANELEM